MTVKDKEVILKIKEAVEVVALNPNLLVGTFNKSVLASNRASDITLWSSDYANRFKEELEQKLFNEYKYPLENHGEDITIAIFEADTQLRKYFKEDITEEEYNEQATQELPFKLYAFSVDKVGSGINKDCNYARAATSISELKYDSYGGKTARLGSELSTDLHISKVVLVVV